MSAAQAAARARHHQHPLGIDAAERVAKAMFRYAYPRGYGAHRLTWSELHSAAHEQLIRGSTYVFTAKEARRIRIYWRTLAYIACREIEHE